MSNPFDDRPRTPAEHVRLYLFAAIQHLVGQVAGTVGSVDAALAHFPFLAGYHQQLVASGLRPEPGQAAIAWWSATLDAWEVDAPARLPLRDLRSALATDHAGLVLLLLIGLLEEDARFGDLFDALQSSGGLHRPSLGLLTAWWSAQSGGPDVRSLVRRWIELGLVEVLNPERPRLDWALQVPGLLWDALRGDVPAEPAVGLRYQPPTAAVALDRLLLGPATRAAVERLPALIQAEVASAIVVRGPAHNGRRTLLASLACAIGRGSLQVQGQPGLDQWRRLGALATLLGALPVVVLDLAPGEQVALPPLVAYRGPLGVVVGDQGGVSGPDLERAVTLRLPLPAPAVRRQHWLAGFAPRPVADLEQVTERFRLTGGNIRRVAALARVEADLHGRAQVEATDVQQAARSLNAQHLDTLAQRLEAHGDWSQLAVGAEVWRELQTLERRCRQRERLATAVGEALAGQLNPGVRALFSGPSGTGKSLAARLLAGALGMDLYRLDLSTVVNKYIGETEKNLERAFARAEELDVILLLDEGDALLTARTSVQTSNDRYANLETNFLLQRLESFEGIVIVTTNASEHIDPAFQRRMDVVISFAPPAAPERWAIWQLHLPAQHALELELLEEVARRCELRGAQIRNAALHAGLLALDDGGLVTAAHLRSAIAREYRKVGALSPLRAEPGGR